MRIFSGIVPGSKQIQVYYICSSQTTIVIHAAAVLLYMLFYFENCSHAVLSLKLIHTFIEPFSSPHKHPYVLGFIFLTT